MLNLFSGKKKTPVNVASELLTQLLEGGGFLLSFQVDMEEETLKVDIFGEDEGLLKTKKGKLLLAIKAWLSRVIIKEFPEEKFRVVVDSNGFLNEQDNYLLTLTDKLMKKALDTGRPVVFKQPLSPNQRRLIHEKVSGNTGVRSQSYGNGVYKKLKLIPDNYEERDKNY